MSPARRGASCGATTRRAVIGALRGTVTAGTARAAGTHRARGADRADAADRAHRADRPSRAPGPSRAEALRGSLGTGAQGLPVARAGRLGAVRRGREGQ